jgi:uncharacterized protein YggU (UPF0235/DUF167 family)
VTPALRATPGGLALRLRVTPNADRDAIEGFEQRDDGTEALRVRVRAVPDRGKANAAVLSLLANALGVPRTTLALDAGATVRIKTVTLDLPGCDLDELRRRLA